MGNFAESESWPVSRSLRQTIAETRTSWARSQAISIPASVAPRAPAAGGHRVAFLIYRGNPRCGGQGVYTRHLTRELVRLGHSVEVFSGPPWPELDEGVGFTPVRGLDLYRDPDPFRIPARSEFTSLADVTEFAVMMSAGFGEPLAYSMRIEKLLRHRRGDFDIIHDNQCMGPGILKLRERGWPLLETLHHPITVDRSIALDHAETWWKRATTRRWFGFLRMQVRVVKQLPAVLTVSHNSKIDINAQMRVPLDRLTVVPVGVDHNVFRPYDDVVKKKGRLMVTSSSDVPMKGLVPLLEAIAKLRVEREIDLIVIGKPKPDGRVANAIERLGLTDIVTTISGVSDEELARLYGEAEVAIVPSLYEGFSLPAIEAMSCAVPVVATTGGALPEVVGISGETGLLVEPNNPEVLVDAIRRLLDDADLRARLGAAGRERVKERFTWEVTARGTAACYDAILHGEPLPAAMSFD
jgi:glycosyltransferase involved in cell wall biosynthesis